MRLIDADKLRTIRSIQSGDFNSIETIQKWIDDAPTVDAVEVVRCEKCKYFTQYDGINIGSCGRLCDEWNKRTTDYCSWGERREDEAD